MAGGAGVSADFAAFQEQLVLFSKKLKSLPQDEYKILLNFIIAACDEGVKAKINPRVLGNLQKEAGKMLKQDRITFEQMKKEVYDFFKFFTISDAAVTKAPKLAELQNIILICVYGKTRLRHKASAESVAAAAEWEKAKTAEEAAATETAKLARRGARGLVSPPAHASGAFTFPRSSAGGVPSGARRGSATPTPPIATAYGAISSSSTGAPKDPPIMIPVAATPKAKSKCCCASLFRRSAPVSAGPVVATPTHSTPLIPSRS